MSSVVNNWWKELTIGRRLENFLDLNPVENSGPQIKIHTLYRRRGAGEENVAKYKIVRTVVSSEISTARDNSFVCSGNWEVNFCGAYPSQNSVE